jgi:hypothetical protein
MAGDDAQEKVATALHGSSITDEQASAEDGYLLEGGSSISEANSLKRAEDGHTILIPQATTDPNDPLNWTSTKKHTVLLVISAIAFLPGQYTCTH